MNILTERCFDKQGYFTKLEHPKYFERCLEFIVPRLSPMWISGTGLTSLKLSVWPNVSRFNHRHNAKAPICRCINAESLVFPEVIDVVFAFYSLGVR